MYECMEATSQSTLSLEKGHRLHEQYRAFHYDDEQYDCSTLVRCLSRMRDVFVRRLGVCARPPCVLTLMTDVSRIPSSSMLLSVVLTLSSMCVQVMCFV